MYQPDFVSSWRKPHCKETWSLWDEHTRNDCSVHTAWRQIWTLLSTRWPTGLCKISVNLRWTSIYLRWVELTNNLVHSNMNESSTTFDMNCHSLSLRILPESHCGLTAVCETSKLQWLSSVSVSGREGKWFYCRLCVTCYWQSKCVAHRNIQ